MRSWRVRSNMVGAVGGEPGWRRVGGGIWIWREGR